jgi:integrase
LSLRSIQYQHAILRKALNDAVDTQQLTKNVAKLVTPPKQKMNETHVKDKRARALTPEEVEKLLDAAKGRRHYHLIQIAIKTGLRRGKLLGLRWKDVDLENRYISVRQTLEKVEGILGFQALKTEKSMRTIPFVKSCVPVFEEIEKALAKDRLHCKEKKQRYHELGLVFCQQNGTKQDPGNVTKQVKKLLDKAGIKNATLHSLSHTFAPNLIARGVPLEQIQVLLGHDSISTTANIYVHILPGVLEETMAKLENL